MRLIEHHRSFKALKTDNGNETFAIALNTAHLNPDSPIKEWVWYPTVCQIPYSGLQLYATRYLVTGDGSATLSSEAYDEFNHAITHKYTQDFKKLGLKHLTKKGRKYHGKNNKFEFDGEGKANSTSEVAPRNQTRHRRKKGKTKKNFRQRCRTVRLITDLKNRGDGSLISNVVQDVVNVRDAVLGAATGEN